MKHLDPVRKISLWQQQSFLLFLTNRKGGNPSWQEKGWEAAGRVKTAQTQFSKHGVVYLAHFYLICSTTC